MQALTGMAYSFGPRRGRQPWRRPRAADRRRPGRLQRCARGR
jgi:hypothetical protein